MNLSHWFRDQLQTSADGFVWGVRQVPEERRFIQPLKPLGEWSVTRHVFHMLYYEQHCALPSMRQWLGVPLLDFSTYDEEGAWANNQDDLDQLLAGFQAVRAEQIALLPQFTVETWDEVRDAVWGPVSLRWVVSKTYQHTAEHTNDVLRIALFWDIFWARVQAEQAVTTA